MSVADQSMLDNQARRPPFTVRFLPQFVNRMCDRLKRSVPAQSSVAGLLFGYRGAEVSEIQVFRSFEGEGGSSLAMESDKLSAVVEGLIAACRKDPEVSALQLIGWYSFRPTGGLHDTDVAFHNRYFRQPNEIALILRPERQPTVVFEIYSKSGSAPLSEEDHRWGSLRLSTDTNVAGPMDIAMRARIGDDFYLRAYQVSKTLDRAERRENWSNAIEGAKTTVRSLFRPKSKGSYIQTLPLESDSSQTAAEPATPLARAAVAGAAEPSALDRAIADRIFAERLQAGRPATHRAGSTPAAAEPSTPKRARDHESGRARDAAELQKIYAGEPPALPAVIKPPKHGIPWVSSVILFALVAGGTAFALYRTGVEMPPFLRAIFPDTGLGLRVEGQGDRVLLSWNRRNALVRASQGGVLHIDDGALHRDVRLDPAQIANGSVLYRPGSDDVSFHLEVHGQQGAALAETTRVLDGADAEPPEVKNQPADVSPTTPTSGTPSGSTVVATPPPGTTQTTTLGDRSPRPTAANQPVAARASTLRTDTPGNLAARANAPETRAPYQSGTTPAALGTAPPPASSTPLRPESSTPAGTGLPSPARPAESANATPRASSESRPALAAPSNQAQNDASRSSATPASTENNRQPDTAKVSNWEDVPSGRTAEPGQSRTAPAAASAPNRATAESLPALTFVPPKPLKQILPDLSSFPPGTIGSASQVEVAVRVNKKGHVTEAYLVGDESKIPPQLAQAALGAAKQWTFQPASVRGKNVSSDHTIVFEFRPANR